MNDTAKTSAFLAISVALLGTALWASIPKSSSVEDFRDVGQPFFPEFTDPAVSTSLEVVELDPATAQTREFAVKQRDGRWIIPSHSDYPADAKDRLAQTAAQVIGLTKDTIRSSRSEDHATLGVLDPRDTKVANIEGAGKRITLKDSSDRVLADYILGKMIPNHPGQQYVRRPGQVRTYGVNVKAEVSTRFADWIEPNLLDLQGSTIVQVIFDSSKWDPDFQRVSVVPEVTANREADGAPWTIPGLGPNEEVDPGKSGPMVQALSDLKIVGVRPKPKGLTEYLEDSRGRKLDAQAVLSLNYYGFRFGRDRHLAPDEGSIQITCADGILYSLMFGRVTFARGEALSAGKSEDLKKADPSAKPADQKKAGANAEGDVESRFLLVTVGYDPKVLPQPKNTTAPPEAGDLPKQVFRRSTAEVRDAADREQAEVEAWRRRIESGRTRAQTLSKRFAPWYFVVPGNDYRTILLDRASLIRPKAPPGAQPPRNPLGVPGMRLPPGARSMPAPPGH